MTEKKQTLTGILVSGLAVIILAGAIVLGANVLMETYMDYDIRLVQASSARAEQLRQAAGKRAERSP